MMTIPDAAIGTMIAALIAGIVSLLGLIISKEQKISEFRQAWIDALRSDLVAYLTHINAIHDAITIKYSNHADKVGKLSPLYIPLNISTFDILLRVNPIETKCARLLETMSNFNALTADEEKLTIANIRETEKDFISASQDLLKSEWRRVKSGELTFKIAKTLALVVIAASVATGGMLAYRAWSVEKLAPVQASVQQPDHTTDTNLTPGSLSGNVNSSRP